MISLMSFLAAILVLGGSVGFFLFPDGLKIGMRKFINLDENGPIFSQFIRPPVSPKSIFYLYAIKNPSQALRGAKASFTLKGPYKFNTILIRDEVKFSPNKERLAYTWGRKFSWDLPGSSDPEEKIWTLNPVMTSVIMIIKTLVINRIPFGAVAEPLVFNSAAILLDSYKERLFRRTTPRQLFDGRVVDLLSDVVKLAKRLGVDSLLPPVPPDNVFGLIYVQNRTFFEVEVWTGVGENKGAKFAEVSKFKGQSRLQIWQGQCNSITGTNGELFRPFLTPGKPIRVFSAPLCRSFNLDPLGTELVRTRSGIMALEYEFGRSLFQGARSNSNNKCFCADKRSLDCQYDGLLSMGPCFYDAPLYLARTNFAGASPRISNLVDLKSANTLNGTAEPNWRPSSKQVFRIEPISGAVLEVDISVMATFKVIKHSNVRDLAKVQNVTYMPLFLNHDAISLPYKLVWQLYYLQKFYDHHRPIMAGLVGLGLGAIVLKLLIGIL